VISLLLFEFATTQTKRFSNCLLIVTLEVVEFFVERRQLTGNAELKRNRKLGWLFAKK